MRLDQIEEKIALPEGVSATVADGLLKVKGPKGEVQRKLLHPTILVLAKEQDVQLSTKKPSKREKRQMLTYAAHIRNMCKGVTEGHTYKLKVCSGHFPMTVAVKNDRLEVKNFFGETVPRTLSIPEGVSVKIEGAEITVEGADKEKVGAMAAAMERLTSRPGFDKRVFQDGIYITEKDGKTIEAA